MAGASTSQPGTVATPNHAPDVVMRLNNAAAGFNDQNRVQNEIAAMVLACEALSPREIVPDVYGWQSAANGQGWILMEHMAGTPLDAEFEVMSSEDEKKKVLKKLLVSSWICKNSNSPTRYKGSAA